MVKNIKKDTFLNYAYRTAPCNAVTNTSSFLMPMWNDTTALFGNPDGSYSNNKMISAGLVIVPFNSYWNSTIFTGQTEIYPSSDYYIDSISVTGVYARNNTTPAKRAVIDTFTIGVVNGNGPITSDLRKLRKSSCSCISQCRRTLIRATHITNSAKATS